MWGLLEVHSTCRDFKFVSVKTIHVILASIRYTTCVELDVQTVYNYFTSNFESLATILFMPPFHSFRNP